MLVAAINSYYTLLKCRELDCMVQEIVVFRINLFVEAIYIKCALCRRAQQTKSHEWRKNGKLIFSVSLVLCGCVRYENHFSMAIQHKIQKWFAIEISRMSAINKNIRK